MLYNRVKDKRKRLPKSKQGITPVKKEKTTVKGENNSGNKMPELPFNIMAWYGKGLIMPGG